MNETFVHRIIRWYKRPNKHWFADLYESLIVIIPVVFLIKTFIFGLYQVPTGSMETTMLVGERFLADKMTPYISTPKRGEIISFNDPNYAYSKNWFVNMYEQYISFNVVNFTKRVIAVPGDHIQGKIEYGKPIVYLNGEKLDEPYLNKYPLIARLKNGKLDYRSYDPSYSFEDQPFYRLSAGDVARAKMYLGDRNMRYPGTPAASNHGDIDIYDVHLGPNEYWMMGDNRQGSSDSRDWGPLDVKKVMFHGRIVFRIWSMDSDESWWIFDLIKHPIDFWHRVRWSRFFQVLH
ncbi:signal peptidase I [Candidatus Babeliales bacterium]|nr:signal peptidase I [Candidatus Babeliales bacterium]